MSDIKDNTDLWTGLGLFILTLVILTGVPYGSYRLGVHAEHSRAYREGRLAEREALYGELTGAITNAYNDGVKDGFTAAQAKLADDCDNLPLDSGHY